MATFATCTHVGDETQVQVNLDMVETIVSHQGGALIKFSQRGALHVRETPDQVARSANPKDAQGLLRVNSTSGRWVDLETGKAGGDVVSLAAYLQTLSQFDAARRIAAVLKVPMDAAMTEERRPTSTAAFGT